MTQDARIGPDNIGGGEAPSGAGVGRTGGPSAFRTIGFSEIEPYACALLAHRFPGVPNLGPVQSVTRDRVLRECGVLPVVVTGGFPCQPHSHAGKRLAGADERDLWAECVRVLREFRPRVALFENVAGLLSSKSPAPDGTLGKGLFFNRVLSDLAEIGFACQWNTLSAAAVGAPHKRERVWLLCVDELADQPGGGRGERGPAGGSERGGHADGEGAGGIVADSLSTGLEGHAGDGAGRREPGWVAPGPNGFVAAQGVRDGAYWPAAHGLWPARPGEAQYEWEPERVVGQSTSAGLSQPGGQRGSVGQPGAEPESERPDEIGAGERETQPELGGNFDGGSPRLDPAPVEVRKGKEGRRAPLDYWRAGSRDTVNRTQRLKALGNGIVPACAMPFAVAIRDYLDGAA